MRSNAQPCRFRRRPLRPGLAPSSAAGQAKGDAEAKGERDAKARKGRPESSTSQIRRSGRTSPSPSSVLTPLRFRPLYPPFLESPSPPTPPKLLFQPLDELLIPIRPPGIRTPPQQHLIPHIPFILNQFPPSLQTARLSPNTPIQSLKPPRLPRQMRPRARPLILLGTLHQPRPHRIPLHIRQRPPHVRLRQRARKVPVLPQMPAPPPPRVQTLRIPPMHPPEQHLHRILPFRHNHKMHVVCHQAPAKYPNSSIFQIRHYQVQIRPPVRSRKEHPLPVRSPLRHMVRQTRLHAPCVPWHLTPLVLAATQNSPIRRSAPSPSSNSPTRQTPSSYKPLSPPPPRFSPIETPSTLRANARETREPVILTPPNAGSCGDASH